jgi:hypothetical protein
VFRSEPLPPQLLGKIKNERTKTKESYQILTPEIKIILKKMYSLLNTIRQSLQLVLDDLYILL